MTDKRAVYREKHYTTVALDCYCCFEVMQGFLNLYLSRSLHHETTRNILILRNINRCLNRTALNT